MKLSEYAKKNNISYQTAWRHFNKGMIDGAYQLGTGTVVIPDEEKTVCKTVSYSRVSSHGQKENLLRQQERIRQFCAARGWLLDREYKEIASGLNDNRAVLSRILRDKSVTRIVVEDKDRLTRFGYNYIVELLALDGREVVVLHQPDSKDDDLIADFQSVIYSFCARLYGRRRARAKADKIGGCLNA